MTERRARVQAASALLAVALVALAGRARAEAAAAAEALFKAGKALADAHQYAAACPKLEASYALDPALGTLLNMADCHEHLGAIARAWSEWSLGVARARKKGDGQRADLAQRHVDALEPRLPRLRIAVTGSAPDLAVVRDQTPVPAGMYGEDVPIDPGAHAVVVRRGDVVIQRVEVSAAERERAVVTLDFTALTKANPAVTPPGDLRAPPASEPPPPTTAMIVRNGFQSGTIAAGAIGLVTAVGLEIGAFAIKKSETSLNCAQGPAVTYCNAQGLSDIQLARTLATVGQWAGLGGIVLLGTGITLAATAPKAAKPPAAAARVWVAPWVAPRAVTGLATGGAF